MQTLKSTPAAYFNKPTMNVHTIAERVNSKPKSKMGYYYFNLSKTPEIIDYILDLFEWDLTYIPSILFKFFSEQTSSAYVLPSHLLDMNSNSGGMSFTNKESVISIAIPTSIFSFDPVDNKGYVIDFYDWFNKAAEHEPDGEGVLRIFRMSEITEEVFLAGLEEGIAPRID